MTWRDGSQDIKRFALIIGAMKAGTTSLFSLLSQHPQICPSRWKEPEYFSKPRRWARLRKNYTQMWNFDPEKHLCAMEASAEYTRFPEECVIEVPERIARYADQHQTDMRMIYVMRDPVDRAESQIAHMVAANLADLEDLAEEQIEQAFWTSSYATQLDRYSDFIEDGRVLLLNFEELRSPEETHLLLGRCHEFLEIDDFQHEIEPPKNTRTDQSAPRTALTPEQRESMRERLLDDVLRLRDDYGVDVNRWPNFRDV